MYSNIEETTEMLDTQKKLKYAKITIENIKSLDENSYYDVVDRQCKIFCVNMFS